MRCPTIAGHYLIEGIPSIHGIIALDIPNPDIPVEVARISFPGNYLAHWTGWDGATGRLVVTPNVDGIHRLYLVSLDQANGKLTLANPFATRTASPASTSTIVSGRRAGPVPQPRMARFSHADARSVVRIVTATGDQGLALKAGWRGCP
jgi:hypothetical protein